MRHDKLAQWMLNRGIEVDKTAMLLEHFLMIHHDPSTNSTVATRKEIGDFTGWAFKTVNKAIDGIKESGLWSVEDESRKLVFTPLTSDDAELLSAGEIAKLVWENSSLSGTELEIALAFVHRWDDNMGFSEASLRDISALTGRSTNTVRDGISAILETGEWVRLDEGYKTRLQPDLDVLSENRSSERGVEAREKTGGTLIPASEGKNPKLELPFMLENWEEMHGRSVRPFTRKRSFATYAQRLIDNTDPSTRKSKRNFNESHITHIYEILSDCANIEIVDTLLTYQCETGGALDLRFLKPVAQRLSKSWRKKPPVRFKQESETSGAYLTALSVWRIIEARQTLPPREILGSES